MKQSLKKSKRPARVPERNAADGNAEAFRYGIVVLAMPFLLLEYADPIFAYP